MAMVIDDREPATFVAALVDACHQSGIEAECKRLHSCDVALLVGGSIIGVERKAVSDFASSFIEGRLHKQLARATSNAPYDQVYLLIEGQLQFAPSSRRPGDNRLYLSVRRGSGWQSLGLNHATVMNCQNGLVLRDPPIGLIRTSDLTDTLLTLMEFHRMLERGTTHTSRVGKIRTLDFRPDVAALAQVHRLGISGAERLLTQFGSILAICQAPRKEVLATPGIGPKLYEEIQRTFTGVPDGQD